MDRGEQVPSDCFIKTVFYRKKVLKIIRYFDFDKVIILKIGTNVEFY